MKSFQLHYFLVCLIGLFWGANSLLLKAQNLGPVNQSETSGKKKARAKKEKKRARYSKKKKKTKKFKQAAHLKSSHNDKLGGVVASPPPSTGMGRVKTTYSSDLTPPASNTPPRRRKVYSFEGGNSPGTVKIFYPKRGAKSIKPDRRMKKRVQGFQGTAPLGRVQTFYPGLAGDARERAYRQLNRRNEVIPFSGNGAPGSVQTFYGNQGKGTRQPNGKGKPVYLPRELFYPGPVDIYHVNKPLPFTRKSWKADRMHQKKMNKVYQSPRVNYLTQEQQEKSTRKYARALWKNYHDNPNLHIERMTQADQMKRSEAYTKAIWNSYGKKKSVYEEMQKDADKRRAKLEDAFSKPLEHKVPERAKSTLRDAAGFDGYIIIDKNKERDISFESAKFRNFYLPLRVQVIRKSSAFSVKGEKKHYIPYQATQIGFFVSPNTNPQTQLSPRYLKKRRRFKYDKGEARMWRELDETTRGRGGSSEASGGAVGEYEEGIDYEYDPDLELQDDPIEDEGYEEPPADLGDGGEEDDDEPEEGGN